MNCIFSFSCIKQLKCINIVVIEKLNIPKSSENLRLYFINIYERSILGPLQADPFNLLAVNNLKFSTVKNFPSIYRSFKLSFKKRMQVLYRADICEQKSKYLQKVSRNIINFQINLFQGVTN